MTLRSFFWLSVFFFLVFVAGFSTGYKWLNKDVDVPNYEAQIDSLKQVIRDTAIDWAEVERNKFEYEKRDSVNAATIDLLVERREELARRIEILEKDEIFVPSDSVGSYYTEYLRTADRRSAIRTPRSS